MITKNYIKMCEQAEEIQKSNINIGKRHFSDQDFVAYNYGEGLKVYVCSEISRYWLIKELIWLPTQEQLQEILQKDRERVYYGSYPLTQFCGWIMTSGGPNKFYWHQYKSLFKYINELWLAFVMHELYNKQWTGKDWKR